MADPCIGGHPKGSQPNCPACQPLALPELTIVDLTEIDLELLVGELARRYPAMVFCGLEEHNEGAPHTHAVVRFSGDNFRVLGAAGYLHDTISHYVDGDTALDLGPDRVDEDDEDDDE